MTDSVPFPFGLSNYTADIAFISLVSLPAHNRTSLTCPQTLTSFFEISVSLQPQIARYDQPNDKGKGPISAWLPAPKIHAQTPRSRRYLIRPISENNDQKSPPNLNGTYWFSHTGKGTFLTSIPQELHRQADQTTSELFPSPTIAVTRALPSVGIFNSRPCEVHPRTLHRRTLNPSTLHTLRKKRAINIPTSGSTAHPHIRVCVI